MIIKNICKLTFYWYLYVYYIVLQGIPYEIDDFIEVIPTPGHTGRDVSVIVRGTDKGTIAITGDFS